MDERTPAIRPAAPPDEQPPRRRPRKPYQPPAVVSETKLEARAGSPPPPDMIDPMNLPNSFGL